MHHFICILAKMIRYWFTYDRYPGKNGCYCTNTCQYQFNNCRFLAKYNRISTKYDRIWLKNDSIRIKTDRILKDN